MSRVVREWTLIEEIGRGGMGVVWLARHQYMAGDWAVKVMRPELMDDQESRDRFLSEAMVLSTLKHPGIVGIQSPFVQDGQLYMPMEYLTGVSLDAALKASPGPWDVGRSVQIITQVADAVGYAHHRNPPVIHRDLKPLNIQLTNDGVAKVLDFGLARGLGDKSMTATGKAVGTPAYMSPEVLEGGKATPRSDIYSLGVILYRLLSGRLPYDLPDTESSLHALLVAVIRGIDRGLPDVREFVPHLSPHLGGLTMRMLSRDPGDRPVDGAELAQMLATVWAMGGTGYISGGRGTLASDDVTHLGIDVSVARSAGLGRSNSTPSGPGVLPPRDVDTNHGLARAQASADADRSLIGINLDVRDRSGLVPPAHPTSEHRNGIGGSGNDDLEAWRYVSVAAPSRRKWWILGGIIAFVITVAGGVFLYSGVGAEPAQADASGSVTARQDAGEIETMSTDPSSTKWVRLPGGTFQMGSSDGSNDDEQPVHSVTLSAFEIAASEVTVAQYRKCVDAGSCSMAHWDDGTCVVYDGVGWGKGKLPASFRGDNQPIVCVDWEQASAYAKWVGGRLPTEAEWEYAARSGGKNQEYPWGDQSATCSYAVINDGGDGCGRQSTWPVCSKTAGNTTQGLCDMAGNVLEWMSDWYGNYSSGSVMNPTGPSSGHSRVFRGGSWVLEARGVRAANRSYIDPAGSGGTLGLRPARSIR